MEVKANEDGTFSLNLDRQEACALLDTLGVQTYSALRNLGVPASSSHTAEALYASLAKAAGYDGVPPQL